MRFNALFVGLLALTAAACGGGDSDSDSDTDGGNSGPCATGSTPEAPSVLTATYVCAPPHQDGADRFLQFAIQATDPQGDFTLKALGHTLTGYLVSGDTEFFTSGDLTCSRDNAGQCIGSVNTSQVGVDCGNLDNYYFTVVIVDDDSNPSNACRVTLDE